MYIHELKSHADIGYANFFDTFRSEYDQNLDYMDENARISFINEKLRQYHAHMTVIKLSTGREDVTIEFKSEKHYTAFLMRWA